MTVDPLAFEKAALARPVSDGLEVDDEVMAAVFDMIRVVNRLLRDFDAHVYRPEGVTWAGFRVLFCLWVEPDVAPARLAVLSGVSRATISSVVNTLERKGLVTRDRRSRDRRVVTVSLTEPGRELVRRAFARQHERERAWLAEVDRCDLERLNALLRELLARPVPD